MCLRACSRKAISRLLGALLKVFCVCLNYGFFQTSCVVELVPHQGIYMFLVSCLFSLCCDHI